LLSGSNFQRQRLGLWYPWRFKSLALPSSGPSIFCTHARTHTHTHAYILNLWHCCHCRKNITLTGEKWRISIYIYIYIKSNVAYIYVWRDAVCFYEGVAHTLAWKLAPSQPSLPVLHGISHIKQVAVVLPSSPYGLCKQSSHCK